MPLSFAPELVEGKVYRSKKRQEGDEEREALREIQTILAYKNRRSCDCEAQVHDLLENCLTCGRLTCSAEGPGKCLSCGNIVLSHEQRERLKNYVDIKPPVLTASPKTKQSERSRMRIIDNQYDHFAIDSKKHLREQDKRVLKENLKDLQSKRFQRQLVLDVNIENMEAGSRSAPVIDDYENALKNLQLGDQTNQVDPSCTLFELISNESKTKYNLSYIKPNELKKRPIASNRSEGVRVETSGTKQGVTSNEKKLDQQQMQLRGSTENKAKRQHKNNKKPISKSAWQNKLNKDGSK